MKLLLTTIMLCGLGVVGCSRSHEAAVTDDVGPTAAPTNRIEIPSTVRRNLGITFAKVQRRRVEGTIRVPGAFELLPRARREYRMMLPGRVELLVDQYQAVERGDLLYRFQSTQWPEIQHEIIVGEQGIVSARAEIKVAIAKVAEANRRLELMRARLAALAGADFKHAELEAQAADLEASLPRLRSERDFADTKLANAERTREHALHRAAAASGLSEEELSVDVEFNGQMVPAYGCIDWIDVKKER